MYRASLTWLIQSDALTAEHAETLDRVRAHRHELAHELARFLVDPAADVDLSLLEDLRGCMRALDRFWGEYEVDLNPDFNNVDIDLDGIRSGTGLMIDYLFRAQRTPAG